MKTILLSTLIAICLPCVAQEPAPKESSIPAEAVTKVRSGKFISQINFEQANLQEIVEFLEKKQAELEGDPLNVVLSPGLETLTIPKMILRNVTAGEVLGVTAKLMGLVLEPTVGDDGKTIVAYIMKAGTQKPVDANVSPGTDPAASPSPSNLKVLATGSSAAVPSETKVFFLEMALINRGMDDSQRKEQLVQLEVMHDFITKVDPKSELTTCAELGLVTVKSTKMPIVTQAIEALQANASKIAKPDATEEFAKLKRQALDMEKRTAELQMELARKSRELDELKVKAAGKPAASVDH